MKATIKDVHKQIGEPATLTHVYDHHTKKIRDVETYSHLLKVR